MTVQAAVAGAAGLLLIWTGWPVSIQTTLLMGAALILWVLANFALDQDRS